MGKLKVRLLSVICGVSLTLLGVTANGQEQPCETGQTRVIDLCSQDHSIRIRAFIDFRRLGEPKQREAATILVKLLDPSHDADCRAAAAESFERIGLSDEARGALGPLQETYTGKQI